MITSKETIQALATGIKKDIVNFQRYQQLLEQQLVLMQQHDSEGLLKLNQRHEKYHQALLSHAQKRRKQLVSIGFTGDEQGMEAMIIKLPPKAEAQVSKLWQHLRESMLRCKRQNDSNGEILAVQQQLLNKLINPNDQYEYQPT